MIKNYQELYNVLSYFTQQNQVLYTNICKKINIQPTNIHSNIMQTHDLSDICASNAMSIYQSEQSNQILIDPQDNNDDQLKKYCYFCKQHNMNSCVNRSLYHKYSDTSQKQVKDIERILEKEKSLIKYRFDQIQYDLDEVEQLRDCYPKTKSHFQIMELFQYYKYRRYVPVFTKSKTALSVTQSIYYYYYERLKLYYNNIKKQLDMTIQDTSKSQDDSSKISDSQQTSKQNLSNLLQDTKLKESFQPFKSSTSKQSIGHFQSQSKALEDVLKMLKKKEDQLKRIKTLKTEDCFHENQPRPLYKKKRGLNIQRQRPFDDTDQRMTFHKNSQRPTINGSANNSHMKLGNVTKINKRIYNKNDQNLFYRYIQQIRKQKIYESQKQIKLRKKSIQNLKAYSKQKDRLKIDNIDENIKDDQGNYLPMSYISSRNNYEQYPQTQTVQTHRYSHIPTYQQSSTKRKILNKKKISKNLQQTQRLLNNQKKQQIRSLPKILMEFENRPKRSMSSLSVKYNQNNYQSVKQLTSKILPLRKQQQNQSPYKKVLRDPQELRKSRSANKLPNNKSRSKSNNKGERKNKNSKDHYKYKKNPSKQKITPVKESTFGYNQEVCQQYKQTQKTDYQKIIKADLYKKFIKQGINTYQVNTCTTSDPHKKTHQNSIQMQKDDNLASVRRKKLQELKIKSTKKRL